MLLIACINVSVLLLVRVSVRRGEWAVRSALGAGRARLVRQILAETGVLAAIGCGAGLLLAVFLVDLSNQFGPIHRTSIEPWTFAFCAGLCIVAAILAGILPATSFSRLPLEQSLRASSPRSSGRESAWRRVLVAGQIGIAIALLFTATALSRSLVKLMNVSPGFSAENVWTGSISLPERVDNRANGPYPYAQFFSELCEFQSCRECNRLQRRSRFPFRALDGLRICISLGAQKRLFALRRNSMSSCRDTLKR